VYIDVHKAIRRIAPAPKARVQKGHIVGNPDNAALSAPEDHLIDLTEDNVTIIDSTAKPQTNGGSRSNSPAVFGTSPKTTFIRRGSGGVDGNFIQVRGNVNDMREHLKHLGPSNLASRPKTTRYNTVKIKPGHPTNRNDSRTDSTNHHDSIIEEPYHDLPAAHGGEGEGLLKSAGKEASDGVQALQQGYGSINRNFSPTPSKLSKSERDNVDGTLEQTLKSQGLRHNSSPRPENDILQNQRSDRSSDTLGSLVSHSNSPTRKTRRSARSGSITENIIEAGGVRKVVLETNSSSGEDGDDRDSRIDGQKSASDLSKFSLTGNNGSDEIGHDGRADPPREEVKKKRRRTRKRKGGKNADDGSAAESSSKVA
jgi:metal transporter CNNM